MGVNLQSEIKRHNRNCIFNCFFEDNQQFMLNALSFVRTA